MILDLRSSGEEIAGYDSALDIFTKQNMRFVLKKLAPTQQNASRRNLNCGTFSFFAPLHKSAVVQSDRTGSRYFCNLIAWPPEGAIADPDDSTIELTGLRSWLGRRHEIR